MNNHEIPLADFNEHDFVKIDGFPHITQKSVMPVVAFMGNEVRMLGTCFAISNHGLVITARHVLDEAIKITGWMTGHARTFDRDWWVGALYVSEPIPGEAEQNLLGGFLPANKIHMNGSLDIGIMHLNLPVRRDNEAITLHMPALKLSPALPCIGDYCIATGYHNMNCETVSNKSHSHRIMQSYSTSRGVIEEIHFPYRDKTTLKFPCFRTSSQFEPGMSGAPIIGRNGAIIGVVCSSLDDPDGNGYISYGSLIGLSLFLHVDAANDNGEVKTHFLYDFIKGGSVVTDDTIKQLRINRHEDSLEIDFNASPTIRSVIGEGLKDTPLKVISVSDQLPELAR